MKIKNNKVVKPKNRIFNFPLSTSDRNHLEELATTWGVSLAGAIRRSLITSYESLEGQRSTKVQEQPKDSHIKNLETMLSLHTELTSVQNKLDYIISLTKSTKQDNINMLQHLTKPVEITAVQISALINTLNNKEQINGEVQKILNEKEGIYNHIAIGGQ